MIEIWTEYYKYARRICRNMKPLIYLVSPNASASYTVLPKDRGRNTTM